MGTPRGAVPAPGRFSPPARAWAQPCAPACACVSVHVCVQACVHVCMCLYVCMHVPVRACVSVCTFVYLCVCAHMCASVHMCVHVYPCVHVCMHVHVHPCVCVCVSTCVAFSFTPVCTRGAQRHTWGPPPLCTRNFHLFQVKGTGLAGLATLTPCPSRRSILHVAKGSVSHPETSSPGHSPSHPQPYSSPNAQTQSHSSFSLCIEMLGKIK